MSIVDEKVNEWFAFEVKFLVTATFCYAISVSFLYLRGDLLDRSFKPIIGMIILIKAIYYTWAAVGANMYYKEVSGYDEEHTDSHHGGKTLHTALLVLTIINIVDVLRLLMIVALCYTAHFIFKTRARNAHNR